MFNRSNLPNPFGSGSSTPSGNSGAGQGPPPYGAGPPRSGAGGYGSSPQPMGRPSQPPLPARNPVGGRPGKTWHLRPDKSPHPSFTFGNLLAVSTQDFPPSRDGHDLLLLVNDYYVFSARPIDNFPPGKISMSDPQRSWARVALTDEVKVQLYDPFSQGGQVYLGSTNIEVGFAGKKRTEEPYDQDELANVVIRNFQNQIFAPGQLILMDHKSIPLLLKIKTVQRVDLRSEKPGATGQVETGPEARGILTQHSQIDFSRDVRSEINLKGSNRKPAANAIIQPGFKFEDMGIGGLDSEFSTIFRRAFASRVFPPGLVEKLGIQHVKGMLLYGPPGTGKTLIARQIGKMLNAREPKVINGPEVLSKYVGQSEENIRKVFADAESEYKAKGEESGVHIIIFDELDAVCKQRGSTSGGTGVGDSVVNQLLSKLDGVDQLNNILLIGMTNRKDMIDDALLRPGRLEVHVEISLPDEAGRCQILNIHTQKMRTNNIMDSDVDLDELARETKNFSGAEIAGLVKSASSFAFSRHVEVGTVANVTDDVVNMKVNRGDFQHALDEIKPAFGVSEEALSSRIQYGIIHYSNGIRKILERSKLYVDQVRNSTPLFSVLLHGPAASGKTALAAKIAIDSGYPFIKLISPEDMVGLGEMAKVHHITRVFDDAYKSALSVIVVDNIERIIDYVPSGPRFSNTVLQALMVLLRKQPMHERRLLVLATTTQMEVVKDLDMLNSFNASIEVPSTMDRTALENILTTSSAFLDEADEDKPEVSEAEMAKENHRRIQRALDALFPMSNDVIEVGVKKVLLGIETAKQDKKDKVAQFVSIIRGQLPNIGVRREMDREAFERILLTSSAFMDDVGKALDTLFPTPGNVINVSMKEVLSAIENANLSTLPKAVPPAKSDDNSDNYADDY